MVVSPSWFANINLSRAVGRNEFKSDSQSSGSRNSLSRNNLFKKKKKKL
jgi:hypothetical protein